MRLKPIRQLVKFCTSVTVSAANIEVNLFIDSRRAVTVGLGIGFMFSDFGVLFEGRMSEGREVEGPKTLGGFNNADRAVKICSVTMDKRWCFGFGM